MFFRREFISGTLVQNANPPGSLMRREFIETTIDGEDWIQDAPLSGSLAVNSSDQFGYSVAINDSGNRVIIGAHRDERSAGSAEEGLAYIFVSGTGGWTEQHILSGSLATDVNDNFGYSVSMNSSGDRVIVGALNDENLTGNPAIGLAYIFVSGSGGWQQQSIISGTLATNTDDNFGCSVSMNAAGDRVAVGAFLDETSGGSSAEGLAYVFVSGTGGWTEQHVFSGSLATNADDSFGISVSMNSAGDRVIVGADWDERSGGADRSGLAYIIVSGTGGWTEQHILSGSLATNADDHFGYSVSMNSAGDRVIVGAWQDERSGGSSSEGLAYIFVSGTGGWTEQHILSGSLATSIDDNFGYSVSINSAGDQVVVGAWGDEIIPGEDRSGLAYVFVSGTGGWTEQQLISGSLAAIGDNFGNAVAMNSAGNFMVIGALGDERSGGADLSGLGYVYKRNIVNIIELKQNANPPGIFWI